MIAGIGIDIVAIERFQRFIDENNTALLLRLFTGTEREYCAARKVSCAASFAARFAAKEAFMKALGTGLRDGISWHDIETVNDRMGKPVLVLTGRAMEIFLEQGLGSAFLSLAHDSGSAVATVVLEKS